MTMSSGVEEFTLQQQSVLENGKPPQDKRELLKHETRNVIEEARVELPEIQALFGFQTMAVFNNCFEDIAGSGKLAYLVAFGLLVFVMGLSMAPATYYHLLAERARSPAR
jgi:hypothetical protein